MLCPAANRETRSVRSYKTYHKLLRDSRDLCHELRTLYVPRYCTHGVPGLPALLEAAVINSFSQGQVGPIKGNRGTHTEMPKHFPQLTFLVITYHRTSPLVVAVGPETDESCCV